MSKRLKLTKAQSLAMIIASSTLISLSIIVAPQHVYALIKIVPATYGHNDVNGVDSQYMQNILKTLEHGITQSPSFANTLQNGNAKSTDVTNVTKYNNTLNEIQKAWQQFNAITKNNLTNNNSSDRNDTKNAIINNMRVGREKYVKIIRRRKNGTGNKGAFL